ncbi:MAG: gamma-glutamyl-gamma-aminobutyrate hydrolase family protein [Clostridia bacterium]|nr:gamma-glutamyl-gamma-aminobutyrate hydrolase family protein [Clostridia bacterium]
MRPLIGITTVISDDEKTLQLGQSNTKVLLEAGALPVLLPPTTDDALILQYIQTVDGVLFSGGGDVDPLLFGETQQWASGPINPLRDEFELKLCKALLKHPEKPVLGICRGFQVMNIALGGDIYQDLQSGFEGQTLAHRQKQAGKYASHPVQITDSCLMHDVVQSDTLLVNSFHHQALRRMGDGFRVTATAPDGVIESAELTDHPFFIGVQWHPELLCQAQNAGVHMDLFKAFVRAAQHS